MTTDSNGPRSLDELLSLDYKDMTEDEISQVVEYKAARQAEAQALKERNEVERAASAKLLEEAQAARDRAFEMQDALYQASMARLKASMGVTADGQA